MKRWLLFGWLCATAWAQSSPIAIVVGSYGNYYNGAPAPGQSSNFPVTANWPFTAGGAANCGAVTQSRQCAAAAMLQMGANGTTLVASGLMGWTQNQDIQSQARSTFLNVAGVPGAASSPNGWWYIGGRTSNKDGQGHDNTFSCSVDGNNFQSNGFSTSYQQINSAPDNAIIEAVSVSWNGTGTTLTPQACAIFGGNNSSNNTIEQTVYAIAGFMPQDTVVNGYTCTSDCLVLTGRFHTIAAGTTWAQLGWTAVANLTHHGPAIIGGCSANDNDMAYAMVVKADLSAVIDMIGACGTSPSSGAGAGIRGRSFIDASGNVYGQGDTNWTNLAGRSNTCAGNGSSFAMQFRFANRDIGWVDCFCGNGSGGTGSYGDMEGGVHYNANTGIGYFAGACVAGSTASGTDAFLGGNATSANNGSDIAGYQIIPQLASAQTLTLAGICINPSGSAGCTSPGQLWYSTYFGGSTFPNGFTGQTGSPALAPQFVNQLSDGSVIVQLFTAYTNLPGLTPASGGASTGYISSYPSVVPGSKNTSVDALVKLSADLSRLKQTTYMGGSGATFGGGDGFGWIDGNDNVWTFTVTTSVKGNPNGSTLQPTTSNAFTSASPGAVANSFGCNDGANNIYGYNPAIYELNAGLTSLGYGTCFGPEESGDPLNSGIGPPGLFLRDMAFYPFTGGSGPYLLSVSISPNGSGSVTSTDGFINCPGTCSHSYPANTPVTLNATPAQGWSFSSWSGACSGTGLCSLTMSQNQSVTATFTQNPVYYTLQVATVGSGAVTSTDGFINCPGTCSHSYLANTPVTLDAMPSQGWIFSGWTGACSGVGPCNVIMTADMSLTGVFVESGHGLQFTPATPCRLVDTRPPHGNGPIPGGTSQSFILSQLGGCGIPSNAAAYSLNVTVVPRGSLGYLTVWPTGEVQPYVSTLNSSDGRVKANATIVAAGDQGAVSVYVTDTTDVILDINGYFSTPGSQTLQFYPLTPCRIVDTRNDQNGGTLQAGMERDYLIPGHCGIPGNAAAYSFNVTVIPAPGGLDYLTVWPEGGMRPTVSTLNDGTGTVVANAAIVPAGNNQTTAFYPNNNNTDVIIDIDGYFAAPAAGGYSFYPVTPCRVYDSRTNNGQPFSGERTVGIADSPCAPPSNATGYVFNATVVPSPTLGYLTLWPHGETMPGVSTLNAYDGFITSNMAIVPNRDGSTDAYASGTTQLILDISGYFAP